MLPYVEYNTAFETNFKEIKMQLTIQESKMETGLY